MCSAGGGRCYLAIVLKKGTFKTVFSTKTSAKRKTGHYPEGCPVCKLQTHKYIQCKALIKTAQQHVTALMSPLHLFQAVPQLMSSLNVTFTTTGVVNTVLPDAGAFCLCLLQAYGAKKKKKNST